MAAQNTDKLRKVARKWVGQVGAGGVESGTVTTVPLASTTNLPTETAIMITIDRVDANGVLTPDKEEGIIGVVSGDNLISCIRGVEGTAQAHSVGAVVEVLWTAKNVNDIVDAILAEHSQSGAHTTDTISEKTANAGVTVDGVKHKDGQVYTDQINEKTANAGVTVDSLKIKDGRVVGWDGWMPAEETWTYASTDDPTGAIYAAGDVTGKYSVGMRIKMTNASHTIYGIITVVGDYDSGNNRTPLTFLHEIDPSTSTALHLLENSAITNPYYSAQKVPFGFPLNPDKWSIRVETGMTTQSNPAKNAWYNLGGSINIPIGCWNVHYITSAVATSLANGTDGGNIFVTLSTTNNGETDNDWTTVSRLTNITARSGTTIYFGASHSCQKVMLLAGKNTYYLNGKIGTADNMTSFHLGYANKSIIEATSAYL